MLIFSTNAPGKRLIHLYWIRYLTNPKRNAPARYISIESLFKYYEYNIAIFISSMKNKYIYVYVYIYNKKKDIFLLVDVEFATWFIMDIAHQKYT